jgi:hypothetical protein
MLVENVYFYVSFHFKFVIDKKMKKIATINIFTDEKL